jgi:hypothetical protein
LSELWRLRLRVFGKPSSLPVIDCRRINRHASLLSLLGHVLKHKFYQPGQFKAQESGVGYRRGYSQQNAGDYEDLHHGHSNLHQEEPRRSRNPRSVTGVTDGSKSSIADQRNISSSFAAFATVFGWRRATNRGKCGSCSARAKFHACFDANDRTYSGVLGVSICSVYFVSLPALAAPAILRASSFVSNFDPKQTWATQDCCKTYAHHGKFSFRSWSI